MRILFLAHRVPYPPDKGDKIRSYHEIRHLAQRHDVHLIACADRAEDLLHAPRLREFLASVTILPLAPVWGKLRALAALFTGGSLSVRYFMPPSLRAAVARAVRGAPGFDAVFAYSSAMAAPVTSLTLPVVVDFVDVDSAKFEHYGRTETPPMAWVHRREARRLRAFERRVAESVPLTLVCTADEARVLQSFARPCRLEVLENGIDLSRYAFVFPEARRASAVFVGAMDYLANVDACEHFARAILPLVRRELPEFQFRIVGRHPTRRVQALHDGASVVVTGAVADVNAELNGASVSVAPLRVARGIQNKVLEAFAAGTPVVASSAAAEGIEATSGEHLLVADQPAEFARAVVMLVRDRVRARALATAARALVERRYRWEAGLERLEQLIVETVAACGRGPMAGGGQTTSGVGGNRTSVG
ncbi:MAG: TIGR03087 family PEP-CTERM/XrtA system glycosyltransferase [Planctomycetota bacterium]